MSFNTALIVDDSKLARIALKKKLEKRGLEIVMAEDAKQALGLLENSSIDIVFMDHLMPDMDGFEATQEIKSNVATAHLPVIMCSGKEKQGYLEEARAIGASNVLPKPAENEAIAAVFDELEALAAANEPVASEQAPAATVEPGVSETRIQDLLQPLSQQLGVLSAQLTSQASSADDRFATVADTVQAVEARQLAIEPLDMQQLKQQWAAQLDQRFAELALPDQAQLKQQLAGELASEMGAQWDSKLSATVAGLEELIEAAAGGNDSAAASQDEWMGQAEQRIIGQLGESFNKLLEDKSQQLEASLQQSVQQSVEHSLQQSVQQQIESLRAELSEEFAAAQPVAAEVDVEALKQGLKAELIAELQQPASDTAGNEAETAQDTEVGDYPAADVEEAVTQEAVMEDAEPQMLAPSSQDSQLRQEITTLKMLTLATSLIAVTATVLHWF